MLSHRRVSRRGYTIIEAVVALLMSAIVTAMVGTIGFRQQRFHRDVVAAVERMDRLDQSTALVPVTLRSIAPGEGDIPAGQARDTALEFRATIATAVVCDTSRGTVLLAPAHTDPPFLAAELSRPEAGDTAWSLVLNDSSEAWSPSPIAAVSDSLGVCTLGGSALWAGGAKHPSLALRLTGVIPVGPGAPMRITRLWRYSLYRASDGAWYLGAREWNSAQLRYNSIQPVSGPFASAATGGIAFRYFDSAGAAIPSGSPDPWRISLIQAGFRVDSLLPGAFPHAIGIKATAITALALRNRAR